MIKQYIPIRFPKEAYEDLKKKQEKMQELVKSLTGKNARIPLTKILVALTKTPINLPDEFVLRLSKKKVKNIW